MFGWIPLPVSGTVRFGILAASDAITTFAARAPACVGVNVTWKAAIALGASVAGRFGKLASAKSPGLAPPNPMDEIFRLSVPVLVIVMVCAAEVVLTR